jgi:hypothetical protein
MPPFIVKVLLLRRLVSSHRLMRTLFLMLAAISIVAFIWTACLFLTLEQRTSVPYAHTHSAH